MLASSSFFLCPRPHYYSVLAKGGIVLQSDVTLLCHSDDAEKVYRYGSMSSDIPEFVILADCEVRIRAV